MIGNIRSKELVIYRGKPVYRKRIVLEGNPLKKVEEIDIFKGILKTSEGFSEKTVKQEEVKQYASA